MPAMASMWPPCNSGYNTCTKLFFSIILQKPFLYLTVSSVLTKPTFTSTGMTLDSLEDMRTRDVSWSFRNGFLWFRSQTPWLLASVIFPQWDIEPSAYLATSDKKHCLDRQLFLRILIISTSLIFHFLRLSYWISIKIPNYLIFLRPCKLLMSGLLCWFVWLM